ncbi:hypothetical protein NKH89_09475 [Mesorhizobium sp. M0923]|uniref:hypothetical protein n=1 Tax=Mesorhizobium sp. M0923 TaxID=2957028 RepID=UPI0033372A41
MNASSLILTAEQIAADIGVFADVGTEAPSIENVQGGKVVRFTRNGEATEIAVASKNNVLIEKYGSETAKHANFKALLASDRFGGLREWATKQLAYISQELSSTGDLLEIYGTLNGGIDGTGIAAVDQLLAASQANDSTRILLIDGPAGIGKTQFILSLTERRVRRYLSERRPLILHIQSRGRTLSYLYDLIAFSLQRLRVGVTFDQVPILAKYGLITIAIDGFDELADPDGYDLAWSQVSDLIQLLRGSGSLILAGRETFIGRDRVLKDIASLRDGIDEVSVLTLQPPTKTAAINWLQNEGWTNHQVGLIEGFLEPSSLALRPFFLKTLSDPSVAALLSSTSATSVLSILMQAMIEREVDKFGEAVDRELTRVERRAYLHTFVGEVARDIAESGTSSISDATLSWLVEASLPWPISENILRILKARSQFIAFFTNDDRTGYRRFFHEKFYEYFLAEVLVDTVGRAETGKLLGRSIFGSSLLETFGEVISSVTRTDQLKLFLVQALRLIQEYPPIDRTRKNLAALAIASLSTADVIAEFQVSAVEVDECRFTWHRFWRSFGVFAYQPA